MSVSEAVRDLVNEIMDSMELATRNGFHLEPRCRVCRNDLVRKKVNQMLATAAPYAGIVRALAADNAELDTRDRVTLDSIRTHATKHFPVQSVAKATYRSIVERRAQENRIDFIEGVATALTPLAFFEVVMTKAFRRPWWTMTPRSAWRPGCAPPRSCSPSSTGVSEAPASSLGMKVQLYQIGQAVRSVVPEDVGRHRPEVGGV